MTADIYLNDASFRAAPDAPPDVSLFRQLFDSFLALRAAVPQHEEQNIVPLFPPTGIYPLQLPGGTRVAEALKRIDPTLAQRYRAILTRGRHYQPPEPGGARRVLFQGEDLAAVHLAQSQGALCWSVGVAAFGVSVLGVSIESENGTEQGAVANLWRESLEVLHLETLGRSVDVLPAYEDDGRHVPGDHRYVSGKAHIPTRAAEMLRHARKERDASTWWVYCKHRFFHRFQGRLASDGRVIVHWNGTTNPKATQSTEEQIVPIDLRRVLIQFPAPECGCRELKGR